jgi:hypothetical protein
MGHDDDPALRARDVLDGGPQPRHIAPVLGVVVRDLPVPDARKVIGQFGVVGRDVGVQRAAEQRDFGAGNVETGPVEEDQSAVHGGVGDEVLRGLEADGAGTAVEFMVSGDEQDVVELGALRDEEVSVGIAVAEAANVSGEEEDGGGFGDGKVVLDAFEVEV